jgi:acetyl-CoA acetyltransferase family protein
VIRNKKGENMARDVVIVEGARTAMADFVGAPNGGAFKNISAIELGGLAIKGLLNRIKIDPSLIGEVIMGYGIQSSPDGGYGARHASLLGGMPHSVPALTVGRTCGSGFQGIISGAKDILLGETGFILAGGMENMSQAPYVLRGVREGFRMGSRPIEDWLVTNLFDSYCNLNMAQTADKLAKMYSVTREDADLFAYESNMKASRAAAEGRFKEEIVPVQIKTRKGPRFFDADDHIKSDTTMEILSKIPPAFDKDSIATGGNASGIVDGAGCILIADSDKAKQHGLEALAKVAGWAVVGVDPSIMGIGAAVSINKVLEKTGLKICDIDIFEINEAFGAQIVAVERELGLDRSKLNVNGGAIALGHPLGMSGVRLTYTLALELKKRNKRYGIASACTGGGQGVAILLERN